MTNQFFFLHLLPELDPRLFTMRIRQFIYSQWCVIVLCTVALVTLLCLTHLKYRTGITELKQQINPIFKRAIDKELEIRFTRGDIYHSSASTPTIKPGDKTFTTENGSKTFPSNKDLYLYGNLAQQAKQAYLHSDGEPLHADSLNFYFKNLMQEMGIKSSTQVIITDLTTQSTTSSGHTSSIPIYPYSSDALVIDYLEELQVQAFVNYPFLTILFYEKWPLYQIIGILLVGLLLHITGILAYCIHQQKKRNGQKKLRLGNLTFDVARRKLYSGKEEIEVRAQLAKLIILFLEAPDHILTKEEIKLHFWPQNAYQTDSKIHNLIANLRQVCKLDPSIRIESISQQGYQLTW